ncbi:MAG: LacI family DNA-binding transcriptional regulator [Bacteroidota bacterium]
MKRVTIKDLAKMLNLSTSTVSRALSDHPDISEATKRKVNLVAEELNYTTNIHARLFRKQNSGLVALVLPEMNMFFTPSLIKGINKTIAETNYSLITFLSNDDYQQEKEIIKQCLNWAVEGVLISLSKETKNLQHLAPLSKAKIHCVLLDKSLENEHFHSITIDSIDAAYQAVSYLLKKGHQNILGIFGNPALTITQERIKGYKKALQERQLPIPEENIISIQDNRNLDFILPPILRHNKAITAIFTMSDELLSKSLYHLNKMGFSIPEDISVISISDGIYPYIVHPKITHIKDSGDKMGESSVGLLLDSIAGKLDKPNAKILVPTKLVELESTAEL